jgi:hypothetical protein
MAPFHTLTYFEEEYQFQEKFSRKLNDMQVAFVHHPLYSTSIGS